MPALGETWNQFRLLKLLGKGGMGEVFLAEDTSLNRKAALKFLPKELQSDRKARERFLQEARSAAALDHPYICKIFEIGEVDQTIFIAMEFVEGVTLFEKLAKGPMPLLELLEAASEIAEAVEAAHKKQILHRDLKTANVMMTPDGHVKVMDFGLAKHVSESGVPVSKVDTLSGRLTDRGATPGTIIYMSPEQVRGEPLDARSDIFSLGVILYEMTTGRVPFQGATSGLTYDAILNRGPAPPRSLNPDLPVELEQVIGKALEKDRGNRYQSAQELSIDLRRLKRDSDSGTFSFGEQVGTAPSRRAVKSVWLPAVVAALVIVAGLGLWWALGKRGGGTIDSLAVLPFENTRNDPEIDYLTDGIAETLINRLSQLPRLKVMARSTAFRYRSSKLDPQGVGRELGVGAVLTGRIVQQGRSLNVQAELVDVRSGTQIWGEQYNRELEDIVTVQNNIAQDISRALRLELTGVEQERLSKYGTASSEAYQAYLKGRYFWNKRTNEDFKKAIGFFEEAQQKDPSYALAYVGLADTYALLGLRVYGEDESVQPQEAIAKAKATAQDALRLDDTLAEAWASMAFLRYFNDWDWEGAEKDFQRSLGLNSSYSTAHQWFSLYLSQMERYDEAIEEGKVALELEPTSPIMNRNLGILLFNARRYPQAIEQLQKTMELDPAYPLVRQFLVSAFWLQGMKDRAVTEAQKLDPQIGRVFALANEGNKTEVRKLLASAGENTFPARLLPQLFVMAGDTEGLFLYLENGFEKHDPLLPNALTNPFLDSVRADPRYLALKQRVGLKE